MNPVTDFLSTNWHRLSLGRYGSPPLSTLVLTPGFRASRNVILLVFAQGKAQPVLVAKVSRLPGGNSALRSEAENLETVHRARNGGFDSIPRLVAYSEHEDHSFLVETMLAGSLMGPAAVRRHNAACTEAVLAWLAELRVATARTFSDP